MKFILFFTSILCAQEFDPWSIISSENEPSALVEGTVNAISGSWCAGETDLVIQGAQPIVIRRVLINNEWSFFPSITITESDSRVRVVVENTGATIRYKRVEKGKPFQKFMPTDLVQGYTNTSRGPISSRTNLHNNALLIGKNDKELIFHSCDGTVKTYQCRHHGFEYCLISEHLPNGNWILYHYDKYLLASIRSTNPAQTQDYARVEFFYESGNIRIVGSDGQKAVYWYQKRNLEKVACPTHPDQKFEYNKIDDKLNSIHLPDGRFLKMDYYTAATEDVNGHRVHMENYEGHDDFNKECFIEDPRCKRIKTLRTPIGTIAAFLYDLPNRKTTVYDVEDQKTEYMWDDNFRLTKIERFDRNGGLQNGERFAWDETGKLISKSVVDSNGNPLRVARYTYNSKGDILEERIYGNLSARGPPLILNAENAPIENGVESYVRRFSYIPGDFNLLESVEDSDGKRVEYAYLSNTDLPVHQDTYVNGHHKESKYWEYDANRLLIREVTEDLSTCLIRQITPKPDSPYRGMPWIIEEKYLDHGQERLIRKTALSYATGGRVSQRDIYDSEGDFQYSLKYKYDHQGRLIEQTDPIGRTEQFSYDENGNKILHRNSSGRTSATFTYDSCNRLTSSKQTGDDGIVLQEQYDYDRKHRLIREEKPLGYFANYHYDTFGNVAKKEIPDYHFTYVCDSFGRVISETNPEGFTTRTSYNAYNKPIRIEHPDGGIEEFIYYVNGLLKTAVNAEGVETSYSYDYQQRQISKTITFQGKTLAEEQSEYDAFHLIVKTDAEGNRTTYSYDTSGKLIATELSGEKTEYTYDSLGRLSVEKKGDLRAVKKYDLLDRVIEESRENSQGQVLHCTQYSYDSADNQTETIRLIGGKESKEQLIFDSLSRPISKTDPLGHATQIFYKHTPFLKEAIIDPLGLKIVKTYNAHRKVVKQETFSNLGKSLNCEEFVTNFRGQIVKHCSQIFDPNRTICTIWQYDSMGHPTQITEAADTSETKITKHSYDEMGRLKQTVKPNGIALNYSYDSLGRLSTLYSSDSTIHYNYVYDRLGRQLSSIDMRTAQKTEKRYDPHGRITQETLANGTTYSVSYDSTGRRRQFTLPDTSFIQYDYDALYLRAITRCNSHGIHLYKHTFDTYDQSGHLIEETLIGNLGKINHRINPLGQRDSLASPYAAHEILERDAIGNILKTNWNGTFSVYKYDDLYQVISESGPFTHEYSLDAHHCRLKKDDESYQINNLLQVCSHLEYDTNGNPTQQNDVQFTYDALDRLIKAQTPTQIIEYTYDSDHRRLSKTINQITQIFLYDGQNEIGSIDSSGEIGELRILGRTTQAEIGSAIAIELQGKVYAPIHDLMSNIFTLIALDTKKPEIFYSYSAYGEEQKTDIHPNPWRFSSKRIDDETGFVYYGRRYYSPVLGRWLTPDPSGFTDHFNLYAFVRNNSLIHVDLYGLYTTDNASDAHFRDVWSEGFGPRSVGVIGDSSNGTIHYHCGINNNNFEVISGRNNLHQIFEGNCAVEGHWIHDHDLLYGLRLVGSEKLRGKLSAAFLAPGLTVIANRIYEDSYLELSIQYEVQLFSILAQEIIKENDPNLKQVHVIFSNAGYVVNEALQRLPEEYRNTIIPIAVGTTKIIENDAAHQVYNLIGEKDWASRICNGYFKSLTRSMNPNADIKFIPQSETQAGVRGHYFQQPDYQKSVKEIINMEIIGIYEIH